MTSEGRLPCATEGCSHTILPETAERTGGICRPCEQRIARERHQAFVLANRREVDRFAGVTDPIAIIRGLLEPRSRDELVVEKPYQGSVETLVAALSQQERDAAIDLAISYLADESTRERATDLGRWLAAFTTEDLARLQRAMLDFRVFYPGLIFREATPEIARAIIDDLPQDRLGLSHALSALAWAGNDVVQRQFAAWRVSPPGWADMLYVAPHQYAHEAGWELDAQGERRNLYVLPAHALVPTGESTHASPVSTIQPEAIACEWCRGPLTRLVSIEPDSAALCDHDLPTTVATCAACTCYEPVFMKLGESGDPVWHPANRLRGFEDMETGEAWQPERELVLGTTRLPYHASDQFLPTSLSQLGGLPAWIYDSSYLACPECQSSMMLVAQIHCEDVDRYSEGVYYALWCSDCRVTGTCYQQT